MGRGENLWIEAGAGTGKTTLLVARIFSLLTDAASPTRLRDIAAITFTEKAAGELKVKIRERVERALREEKREREQSILRQAIEDLEIAPISTLHAFAFSLLKERPVEAGIDPNAGPDDDAARRLLVDFYNEWFDRQIRQVPVDPALRWYLEQRELYQRQGDWDWLWKLARVICANRDTLLTAEPTAAITLAELREQVIAQAKVIVEHAREFCRDAGDKALANTLAAVRPLTELPSLTDLDAFFAALDEAPKINLTGGKAGAWGDDSLTWNKEQRRELRERCLRLNELRHAERLRQLFRLAQGFARAYDEQKQIRGLLGFDDLLVRAVRLLRDFKDVRAYFQHRFRFLVIDEFQDTDPLQVEIAFFLCEDGAVADRAEDVRLKPGKLVVVGDPKQSIYRFRRADIEVYEKTKDHLLGGQSPLAISVNFRCAPAIIDAVNEIFAPLMHHDPERPASPQYVRLTPGRKNAPAQAGVYVLRPDRALRDGERPQLLEMAAIAQWIQRAVQEQWPVEDKETGKPRPMRWADIAVLFRRTSYVDLLENALRAQGVPYRIEGGKSYYRRPETEALVHALSALEDADNSRALSQWLGSDLVGFSDEALLVHVLAQRADRRLSFYGIGQPTDEVGRMLVELRRLHESRNKRGCLATVRDLFDLVAALPTARTFPHAEVAVANLHKVLEAARAADDAGLTFGEFAREWAAAYDEERDEADYFITEADDDLVRILTIHKAKGLDWPAVVVPELWAAFHPPPGVLPLHYRRRDGRLSFRLATGYETEDFAPMHEDEEMFEIAERQRLLYVAMTRARDYLVLPLIVAPQTRKDGSPSERQNFLRFFADAGFVDHELNLLKPALVRDDPVAIDELPVAQAPRWDLPRRVQQEKLPHALARQVEDALRERERLRLAADRDDLEPALVFTRPSEHGDPPIVAEARRDGRKLGSAFHRLVERIDLADPAGWPKALALLGPALDLSQEQVRLVGQWLDRFAQLPAVRLAAANPHGREIPFTWTDPSGVAYLGQLDLLAETPDGLLILDYKTDPVTAANLDQYVARYRRQAEIYRDAVRALRPDAKAVRMVLCFVDAGWEVAL